ncbi:MAG: hypothetical protein ABIR36_16395 [Nitrospiraceae bacterium]
MRKQLREGLQPSGGRADPYNEHAITAIVRPVLSPRLGQRMSWTDYSGLASLLRASDGRCTA